MTITIRYLGDAPNFLSDAYLSDTGLEVEGFEPFGLFVRNPDTGFETRYFGTGTGDGVPLERVTFSDGSRVVVAIEADPPILFDDLVPAIYEHLAGDPTALRAVLGGDLIYDGAGARGPVLMEYFLWAGIDGSVDLRGSDFGDLLIGTMGDDLIRTGGGSDSILATAGDDTLDFGGDAALGIGPAEEVIVAYDDFDALAPGTGVAFLIDLARSRGTVETPRGTDQLVNLRDAASSDGAGLRLSGTSGDDRFEIAGAVDTRVELAGGGGDDVIVLNPTSAREAVRLTYDVSSRTRAETGIVADFSTGVVQEDGFGGRDRIELAADAPDILFEIEATIFADRIVGRDADDVFFLQGGDDTLDGGAGRDMLVYDGDVVTSGVEVNLSEGIATGSTASGAFEARLSRVEDVRGTRFDDVLTGDGTANLLIGGGGKDTIRGGAGNDTLDGGEGRDVLDGGAGADAFRGGGGADTFVFDDRRDTILDPETTADDTILSTVRLNLGGMNFAGAVELQGAANLRVDGNGSAENRIVGNDGRNILVDRGGGDTLTGGAGDDVFAFVDAARSSARITDFSDGDRLALDGLLFGLGRASIDVREVTQQQIATALRNGTASYDRETGALRHDRDGSAGPIEDALVVIIEGGPRLTAEDILLF